ncbi:MAG: hypothetical protein ACRD29_03825 [Acidimicrobiales bacterium]
MIAAIAAANGRRVVPSAVRVEAGWDRSHPRAANANRLVKTDDLLDAGGADRAVQLFGGSVGLGRRRHRRGSRRTRKHRGRRC